MPWDAGYLGQYFQPGNPELEERKTTWIFADEFYLLFRYQYSADFFYRLYKRIRKYQGFVTGFNAERGGTFKIGYCKTDVGKQ